MTEITDSTRRRWFRFSLRTFFILLTSLCIWLGWQTEQARRQRDAVAMILSRGGSVTYDYQRVPQPGSSWRKYTDPKLPNPSPEWIRTLVGDDFFGRIGYVNLTDASLEPGDLATLQSILPNLEGLSLRRTKLAGKPLSDLNWLKTCSRLAVLDLTSSHVAGNDIAALSGLKQLRLLGLWKTPINDQALVHLAGLTDLENLVLDETNVSDAGLVHLDQLVNLSEWLGLTNTQVTDAGLVHFRKMVKLKSLNLRMTKVTPDGAEILQKALPGCFISVGP